MMDRDPTQPEIGSPDWNNTDKQHNKDVAAETGTTTVGLVTDDGVVIGTDRKASLGGRVTVHKSVVKVEQVHPTAALTLVGSVGGAQSFIDHLRSEASLNQYRRSGPLSIPELAKVAGNFARGGPFFMINPILGGVDDEGSHVYTIDPAGGVMKDDYNVTGSGMPYAYGVLENRYEPGLSQTEAKRVARDAIEAAAERDSGSGNGLVIADIDDEGVEITEYDDYTDEF